MSRNLVCIDNLFRCAPNKFPQHLIIFFFLVITGTAKTSVCLPPLILRCTVHRSPSLDWPGSTERRLDHSLGKLEPCADSLVFSGWIADCIPSLDVRIQRKWPLWQNNPGSRRPSGFQFLRFGTRRERRQPAYNCKPSLLASRGSVGVAHPRCRQLLYLHDRLFCLLLWSASHLSWALRRAKTCTVSCVHDCGYTGQSHPCETPSRHIRLHARCYVCCFHHSVHFNGSEDWSQFKSSILPFAGVWWRTSHLHSLPINILDCWFSCSTIIFLSSL